MVLAEPKLMQNAFARCSGLCAVCMHGCPSIDVKPEKANDGTPLLRAIRKSFCLRIAVLGHHCKKKMLFLNLKLCSGLTTENNGFR